MSSYLSNLLTHTTSRYNSLRRTLLSSEEDGDTEDDTHICRVLRAYYTEKARGLPAWLPADPNDRKSARPDPHAQQSGYFNSVGAKSSYGSVPGQADGRGGLSDLWDPPAAAASYPPPQPQSLRSARRPVAPSQGVASNAPPQARPLPSQRSGSYQNVGPAGPSGGSNERLPMEPHMSSSSSNFGGGTAQERLKARLWGGRPGAGGPPQSPSFPRENSGGSYGGGGGSNPYDSGPRYGR